MVQHIVMWKFQEGCQQQADEFLEKLAALDGVIECIRYFSVTKSAVENGSFDAVLVSHFDTMEDINRYRVDPRHVAVASLCKPICVNRCAIDSQL